MSGWKHGCVKPTSPLSACSKRDKVNVWRSEFDGFAVVRASYVCLLVVGGM